MNDLIDITLDPEHLVSINEVGHLLQELPGESYSELIDIDTNILRNKTYFRDNNILNLPYKKNRNINNNDLDISVILLCHGGNKSSGTMIRKKHNFWKGDSSSHVMLNCNNESVIGIKANTVRLYNDVGFDVVIIGNIYRLLIAVFYFNSIVCLLLLYLQLNLFTSRKDKKTYPYKKLYTLGRQSRLIENPLKNIKNNSNINNSDFQEATEDKNFHYYIPNISLSTESSHDYDENYIVFLIENKGKLQIYKFSLSYKNIIRILTYNNITDKNINVETFIKKLNIADIITIIYNTIEQKILPNYNSQNNLHISLDLMFCKGGLIADNYVINRSILNECYDLTNDFGYHYVGNIKYCNPNICQVIKQLDTHMKIFRKSKNSSKKIMFIDVEEYFKKFVDIDFDIAYSYNSAGQFIEEIIEKENEKYNNQISNISIKKRKVPNTNNANTDSKIKIKQFITFIKNLKKTDFAQKGSGRKYKTTKNSNKNKSKDKPKGKSKGKSKNKLNNKPK